MVQDDNLFPLLTTRETLMFSARLRIPNTMSYAEKAERVDSLIQQLGLQACADTKVGDEEVIFLLCKCPFRAACEVDATFVRNVVSVSSLMS